MKWAAIPKIAVVCATISLLGHAPISHAQTMAIPLSLDCKKWPALRNEITFKAMVQGYLSGMSQSYWLTNTHEVGKAGLDPLGALSSMDEAYLWIDSYCTKNLSEPLPLAMNALFFELERRQRSRQPVK